MGFLFTAFAVFDFSSPRWLPWVGCLSMAALGPHFCCKASVSCCSGVATYLAFRILGQQFEAWAVDVFLVWCCAAVLLTSHGKMRLFGIGVMALAVGAEIYSYVVRYSGSGAAGVSPLLKLVLLLPFVWLLLKAARRSPFRQAQQRPEVEPADVPLAAAGRTAAQRIRFPICGS